MKPATVFLRSCGLTAVLLAGAVNSYAGIVFVQKGSEQDRFDTEEVRCKQDVIQAEVELKNDKLHCKDSDTACFATAYRKFHAKINNVQIRRNNNNGTDLKWLIEHGRVGERKKVWDASSDADAVENLRHFDAETGIQKEVIDVDTQYENDKVLCDKDKACLDKAFSKFKDTMTVQIGCDRNTEDGIHQKYLIAHPPPPKPPEPFSNYHPKIPKAGT
jgi:hypothetical protein